MTLAKLHTDLSRKNSLEPLCDAIKDLFTHKFGSGVVSPQFWNFVEVFVVVLCEHVFQNIAGLTNIDDPIVSLDEGRRAKLTINNVGGPVKLLSGTELSALEGVCYHH